MSFINAIKILINRFGVVWGVLLFVLLFGTIILGLGAVFVAPVINAFKNAGVGIAIKEVFEQFLTDSFSFARIKTSLADVVETIKNVYVSDSSVRINSTLLITLVFGFLYRFLLGFYELPLISVFENKMSANAKISYGGKVLTTLGVSLRYSLIKLVCTLLYDTAALFIMYGVVKLFGSFNLYVLLPFVVVTLFILLQAFRYSIIALWSPHIVVGKNKVFKSLFPAIKMSFRNFGRVFGAYIIMWVVVFAVNVIVGIITFGAGLLLTVPASMCFVSALNMTLYYSINGISYYVDGKVLSAAA